jgi:hypothetical protein
MLNSSKLHSGGWIDYNAKASLMVVNIIRVRVFSCWSHTKARFLGCWSNKRYTICQD